MTVEVAYRYFGGEGKPPLVILHGLLGSSRNWLTVGKMLAERHEVFALDLRNHGTSPHADSMTFADMADDLEAWLDLQQLPRVTLMGHSLGGKVAMRFACQNNERVDSLIVVDISPKRYPPYHQADFEAMNSLPLDDLASRKDAEDAMEHLVPDWAHRKFLLTNLVRDPDAGFHWAVNLEVLSQHQKDFLKDPLSDGDFYEGPTLFVRGARSRYVKDEDREIIHRYFPNYIVSTIRDAGHNVHVDNRTAFLTSLRYFREQHQGKPGQEGACHI